MLNIMKGMREPDHGKDGEISLTALNLSTMLPSSAKNSLSPRSPRPAGLHHQQHPPSQRDLDIDDTVDSSGRGRHSSGENGGGPASTPNEADIKSQFLADLRRLGSHIPPTQGNGNSEPVSTTHSPPAVSASSANTPTATPTKMEDGDLPPRKRKVSQEHVNKEQGSPGYNGVVSSQQEDIKTENNEAATLAASN